ncbi:MAG: AI-2E family transporter [Candidatus Pacebacteria bacterium]|nr:AI-2E family transporter [Candidatus Paceibacterota bacterium]
MKKQKVIIDISYESILRFFLVSFALLFVYYIEDVIFIIFVSVLLALTMEPAVDRMQKKGIPRVFGAGILFSSTLAIIALLTYAIAPTLAREIGQMANYLPGYIEKIDFKFFLENGHNMGLETSTLQDILIELSTALKNAASYLLSGALGLLGGIFSAVLIAVISFYLVLEDDGIEKFARAVMPKTTQPQCMRIIKEIEKKLGQWFVGQVTLGIIIGALSFIGLSLIGVPYALVLALIAGTLELIPYIGPILSAIPAILIAATISPTIAVFTFVLYFFIQEFENYLIVPKVMEKSVGLHPVIIIIAAVIGGQLAGIAGMILAVPIATIAFIVFEDIKKEQKNDC